MGLNGECTVHAPNVLEYESGSFGSNALTANAALDFSGEGQALNAGHIGKEAARGVEPVSTEVSTWVSMRKFEYIFTASFLTALRSLLP